jgi:single-strand DNA-binding protein
MASLNRVVIMGNLGQDPELRYTQNQTPVCTLSVATTDYRTSPDGQRQEFTEWHRVVVWSKQAENCSKYLTKGRTVLVEGRLQTRSWEDKQGQKKYMTEIVASNVQFVGGQRDRAAPGAQAGDDMGYGASQGQGGQGQGRGGYQQQQQGGGQSAFGQDDGGHFGGPSTPSSSGLDDIPF